MLCLRNWQVSLKLNTFILNSYEIVEDKED